MPWEKRYEDICFRITRARTFAELEKLRREAEEYLTELEQGAIFEQLQWRREQIEVSGADRQ